MKDQNINSSIPPIVIPALENPKTTNRNVKTILINAFNKFRSNKKVFLPFSIALGLIFLMIVLGLLFGKKPNNQIMVKNTTSPAPTVQNPQATASGNILSTNQNKLNDLKNQINNFDMKESKLRLPALNFDIKFE